MKLHTALLGVLAAFVFENAAAESECFALLKKDETLVHRQILTTHAIA